jgi:O-antigen/teichoic acid export membrane protein
LSASIYLIKYYFSDLNKKISTSFNDLKAVALEYKDFPTFSLPTTLIDTVSQQLPILLITAFFSSVMSGSYFFAMRILAAPAALIGFAYSQTFFQKFTSYIQMSDYQAARNFLYRSWLLLLSLIAVPALILLFWGAPLFSFVFGNEWSESGAISSILIFYIVFSFISSPTSNTYVVLRMQQYSLFFGVAVLIYRFSSFYIGYLMNDFYLALKILVICDVIEIVIYNSVVINKIRLLSVRG